MDVLTGYLGEEDASLSTQAIGGEQDSSEKDEKLGTKIGTTG